MIKPWQCRICRAALAEQVKLLSVEQREDLIHGLAFGVKPEWLALLLSVHELSHGTEVADIRFKYEA